ncbi:hypothetical protein P0136_10760 [Lentisphaerota bacterium ZTH]|nr:hypothetical protein JYG24_11720 [Lentisphaerota bacterium]WET05842.1 hypothetical protein P0136_10760 [Lentisphaerota bacterium ZTH]
MRQHKPESGASIVEALFCVLLLCLVFLSLLQIWHWSVAKMLCEYSSFYATKASALGYSRQIVQRASRVAATGVSGEDISNVPVTAPYNRSDLISHAEDYMMYSQFGLYGVNFEYWEPEESGSNTPRLELRQYDNSAFTSTRVWISNMPLLAAGVSLFMGSGDSVDVPYGSAASYNHAANYLYDTGGN